MNATLRIFLIVLVGILLFYISPFGVLKFELARGVTDLFDGLLGKTDSMKAQIYSLQKENEDLKIELLNKELVVGKTVKVYSIYPFNNSSEVVIALGARDGAKVGATVVYEKNILIGRIDKIYEDYSTVKTIFDPGFEIAVRIGKSETDALFRGGGSPSLSLITIKAAVSRGDFILTAGTPFKYGLGVGKIGEIKEIPGNPLKEALVEPLIDFKEIRNVTVRI